MMIKAYSYIRFSTPEQAQGDSLRRQTAKAEAWANERGIVLDDSIRDLGVSAFQGANRTTGSLRSFLQMVEGGRIERGSYLIVESLDRLSRETVLDAAGQLFALIQAGVIVVTLSDGQEYSEARLRQDWTPLVISLAVMARAHDESRIKSERVGEAWRQKKAAARNGGKPLTQRCPEWLEVIGNEFVVRDDRVEIVQRIFKETTQGYGRREIVTRLNGDGIPSFRAGERRKQPSTGWQTSSVAKIVQNRAVLGEYQPHSGTHKARNRKPDGDPIKDYYPQIVDNETFWRAQTAVNERRLQSAGRRGDKGAHLLRGLAKCSECQGPMHIVNKGRPPKGNIYLMCSSNRRNAGCGNSHAWRVDKLEEALLLCLTSIKTKAFENYFEGDNDPSLKVEAIRAELEDLNRRNKILIRLAESEDEQAVARFLETAREIKIKKEELKIAEAELRTQESDPGDAARLNEILRLSSSLFKLEGNERLDLRIRLSSLIRRIVDHIDCDPERGAFVVLPIGNKVWDVICPKEGAFAYRPDITTVDGIVQTRLAFLLIKDPTEDERNAFFQDKGGELVRPTGRQIFLATKPTPASP